jgi:hypothetical protein
MLGLTVQQGLSFAILIVAFALLIILALVTSGLLSDKDALAGFGSEPAIVVVSIFVMSAPRW